MIRPWKFVHSWMLRRYVYSEISLCDEIERQKRSSSVREKYQNGKKKEYNKIVLLLVQFLQRYRRFFFLFLSYKDLPATFTRTLCKSSEENSEWSLKYFMGGRRM